MDEGTPSSGNSPYLGYSNVAISSVFVLADVGLSLTFHLGVGMSLLVAALRCIVQLSIMALVLDNIFKTGHPAGVFGIGAVLITLASFETVVNKSRARFSYMFPSVLLAFCSSVVPISMLGSAFAIKNQPFWSPEQYIPILGMLCGSTISALVVGVASTMRELSENKDKTETMLAYGASRFEACAPIAKESLRLALTPVINQTSVLGIISIPGLMTGAILGGSSVEQAARLQIVMMFLIASSVALATMVLTVICLLIVVDPQHRLRSDRIDTRPHAIWRFVEAAFTWTWAEMIFGKNKVLLWSKGGGSEEERQRLLG